MTDETVKHVAISQYGGKERKTTSTFYYKDLPQIMWRNVTGVSCERGRAIYAPEEKGGKKPDNPTLHCKLHYDKETLKHMDYEDISPVTNLFIEGDIIEHGGVFKGANIGKYVWSRNNFYPMFKLKSPNTCFTRKVVEKWHNLPLFDNNVSKDYYDAYNLYCLKPESKYFTEKVLGERDGAAEHVTRVLGYHKEPRYSTHDEGMDTYKKWQSYGKRFYES